jgi:hypothetical protein
MKVDTASIERRYDELIHCQATREYYGQSDLFSFGYWLEDTGD